MKISSLFGTVLAQQCQLPQLKRDDIGWLCNEKFCELACTNGIVSLSQVFIRCWCQSEDECRYIRHYTRYEENMEFELDDYSWQDDFNCESVNRMMGPSLSQFRVEAPVVEGLILKIKPLISFEIFLYFEHASITSARVHTAIQR